MKELPKPRSLDTLEAMADRIESKNNKLKGEWYFVPEPWFTLLSFVPSFIARRFLKWKYKS